MLKFAFATVLFISVYCSISVFTVSAEEHLKLRRPNNGTKEWEYSFITTKKLSWIDAFKSCETLGGSLASVDSKEELEYLQGVLNSIETGSEHAEYVREDSYWVSGSDIYEDIYDWVWMSNGQEIPANNSVHSLWIPSQPDNQDGVQHCTCLWPFSSWHLDDNICESPFNYICKRTVNTC